ncbi:hypothetical protein K8I61_16170 [bacterium]|nr:hypothetical protein [bacterium]
MTIDVAGDVEVVAGDAAEVRVRSLARKRGETKGGKPAASLSPTAEGAKISVRDLSTSKWDVRVEIRVPKDATLELRIDSGRLSARGLTGDVRGEIDGGALALAQHEGGVDIRLDEGAVALEDYRGEQKPVKIVGDEGRVTVSLAGVTAGMGLIKLDKGDVSLSLERKTKIAISAAVTTKGAVSTDQPISRPDPTAAVFTANKGRYLWDLKVEEGRIDLKLPKP